MKRILEKTATPAKSLGNGVFEVKIIEAGWNKSGTRYYTTEALKTTGPTTFRAGRPSFANHPTEAEFNNGRDVNAIMGRLVSDAEFREDDNALWGKLKVREQYIEFVEEYKDTIGLSIFAQAGEITEGEADGRRGMIVESFDPDDPYTSVDFVVAPGAGGKVERMLESFRVCEATVDTRRSELNNLVKDAHASDTGYVWVRDFDPDTNTVYFDVEGADGEYGTFQQTYTVTNDVAVQLDGERVEVRSVTSYVPINENVSKENGMTPEEKAEIAAMVATAVAEALKPAPKAEDEGEKVPTAAEIAEAVDAAALRATSRKRVFEAMTKDPTADLNAVIEAEKALAASFLAEADAEEPVAGRVREAAGSTDDFTIGDWK